MANNRMYLQCKICRKAICIGKYYPSTVWWVHKGFTKRYNKELEDHRECAYKAGVGEGQCFMLKYGFIPTQR